MRMKKKKKKKERRKQKCFFLTFFFTKSIKCSQTHFWLIKMVSHGSQIHPRHFCWLLHHIYTLVSFFLWLQKQNTVESFYSQVKFCLFPIMFMLLNHAIFLAEIKLYTPSFNFFFFQQSGLQQHKHSSSFVLLVLWNVIA